MSISSALVHVIYNTIVINNNNNNNNNGNGNGNDDHKYNKHMSF